MELAAVCVRNTDSFIGQPANAFTSLAFVVAGAGILAARRRNALRRTRVQHRQTGVFALLVTGIGVGSFIQHGPDPGWQAYAHDLPLAGVLVFVAADAVSDLIGRELSPAWWMVPTAAMVPVVAIGPSASATVQTVMAGAAIGLNLLRARRRPALRRTLYTALAVLATGAVIEKLMDWSSLCQPDSVLTGHAIWHVCAAGALWRLAPAIGARGLSARFVSVVG